MKLAFFFQGDSLLLPVETPESQSGNGIPLDYINCFCNPDIFEIPPLFGSGSAVTGVTAEDTPAGWKNIPVRQLLSVSCANIENIIRACHISQWRRESRFCGTCGAKNSDASFDLISQPPAAFSAHRVCSKCGRLEFPRICPAVITAITDNENRILLAHNKKFRSRVYSLISGFNEAGETLEETVMREIREEVNIDVNNIEYVKSQPWPFPNSLMLGFKARYLSGDIKPDGDEIEDAAWFTRDNLPELPGEGSLSRFLINNWLNNF